MPPVRGGCGAVRPCSAGPPVDCDAGLSDSSVRRSAAGRTLSRHRSARGTALARASATKQPYSALLPAAGGRRTHPLESAVRIDQGASCAGAFHVHQNVPTVYGRREYARSCLAAKALCSLLRAPSSSRLYSSERAPSNGTCTQHAGAGRARPATAAGARLRGEQGAPRVARARARRPPTPPRVSARARAPPHARPPAAPRRPALTGAAP